MTRASIPTFPKQVSTKVCWIAFWDISQRFSLAGSKPACFALERCYYIQPMGSTDENRYERAGISNQQPLLFHCDLKSDLARLSKRGYKLVYQCTN